MMKRPRPKGRGRRINSPENSSPLALQAELDLHDVTIGLIPVLQEWTRGGHDDLDAYRIACRAMDRKARILEVVRVNRPAA